MKYGGESDAYLPLEDYLSLERESDTKHEYIDGQMYAMVWSSKEHDLIIGNLFAALHTKLRQGNCTPFTSNMRVRVSRAKYVYPDLTIVCGELEFEDDEVDTILNPTVIVAVLSPPTEKYDRGQKFTFFRQIPSLREYVLVTQDSPLIEHYLRQTDNKWTLTESSGLDATLIFPTLNCNIPLEDIYFRVEFP